MEVHWVAHLDESSAELKGKYSVGTMDSYLAVRMASSMADSKALSKAAQRGDQMVEYLALKKVDYLDSSWAA